MVPGLALAIALDLVGELAVRALGGPLPGPVVGMLLMLGVLAASPWLAARVARGGELLLRHMSLFFVPAALGVVTELDLLRAEALPIVVALVVSTLLAMLAGGWAFERAMRGRA
jgi:putative effector of murein hydrolase LrgA (UPF0299 family)